LSDVLKGVDYFLVGCVDFSVLWENVEEGLFTKLEKLIQILLILEAKHKETGKQVVKCN
jgi:hypothetical protein